LQIKTGIEKLKNETDEGEDVVCVYLKICVFFNLPFNRPSMLSAIKVEMKHNPQTSLLSFSFSSLFF